MRPLRGRAGGVVDVSPGSATPGYGDGYAPLTSDLLHPVGVQKKTIHASASIKCIYISGVCRIPEANVPGNGLPYFSPQPVIPFKNLCESAQSAVKASSSAVRNVSLSSGDGSPQICRASGLRRFW
jgi:hypothetical protein